MRTSSGGTLLIGALLDRLGSAQAQAPLQRLDRWLSQEDRDDLPPRTGSRRRRAPRPAFITLRKHRVKDAKGPIIMKTPLLSTLLFGALLALANCGGGTGGTGVTGGPSASGPLPESQFVELNKGQSTVNGISTKKQTKVISSQADYAAELAIYTSVTPTSVDFTNGRVLLVDMGGRSSSGHSIDVTSVDVTDNSVVANIRLIKPGPSCMVLAVITNPYQFVFIPSLKEILVSERLEVTSC